MAVALTVEAAALHVLGEPAAELAPGDRAAIETITESAVLLVERFASGSNIPAAVCTAAALRMAYFDYWTRMPTKVAPETLAIPGRRGSTNPLRSSGAMALLSPWKRRRAGVVSGEAPAARDRRLEHLEQRLAALETEPGGVSEEQLQSAIAAAVSALPVGVTLPDVQGLVTTAVASLAGRAVELVQVLTWTAPNSQTGHTIRSTGLDLPTGPLLTVGRLANHVGAAYLPADIVSAIPQNDGANATNNGTIAISLGANRGMYLAKSRIGRLKIGATHDGRPSVTMYRLILGAADA